VQAAPAGAANHYWLGKIYYELARYGDGLTEIRQAIKINPAIANYHNVLGDILYANKQYAEAIVAYKEGLRIAPDNSAVHYYIGQSYYGLKNYKLAIPSFQEAARLKPDYYNAWIYLETRLTMTASSIRNRCLQTSPGVETRRCAGVCRARGFI
jgi:tetratricopeptide (TPR) repeat protein